VFAPLPTENRKTVITQFYPMVKYLEKVLNIEIKIDYNDNYHDIIQKIKQGDIDIAYLGPLPYIITTMQYPNLNPIVSFKNKNGKSFYTCSLTTFISNNTEINKINNETIALTQPESTCGYLSVNSILHKNNVNIEDNKYRYIGTHDEAALSVIRGEFSFAGVQTRIAHKYVHLGLKELAKTTPIPNFALVANLNAVNDEMLQKIKKAMLRVDEKELATWGGNIKYGCSESKDKDYDDLRKLRGLKEIPSKGNF